MLILTFDNDTPYNFSSQNIIISNNFNNLSLVFFKTFYFLVINHEDCFNTIINIHINIIIIHNLGISEQLFYYFSNKISSQYKIQDFFRFLLIFKLFLIFFYPFQKFIFFNIFWIPNHKFLPQSFNIINIKLILILKIWY